MNLPTPPFAYGLGDQRTLRESISREDRRNRKIGTNIDLGDEILTALSPDGSRWRLGVSNAGLTVWTKLYNPDGTPV